MRSLRQATAELAACKHPLDQRQHARTFADEPGSSRWEFVRCADCGAVVDEADLALGKGRWTRPMLVAHVIGAS